MAKTIQATVVDNLALILIGYEVCGMGSLTTSITGPPPETLLSLPSFFGSMAIDAHGTANVERNVASGSFRLKKTYAPVSSRRSFFSSHRETQCYGKARTRHIAANRKLFG